MKCLYIDNCAYHHNRDIHIDFFTFIQQNRMMEIVPYGKPLHQYFANAITPGRNPTKDLEEIVNREKPDCILTYNKNGSSYEIEADNPHLYLWCTDFLQKTQVPKYHITTDFLRSGFKQEQADWFKDLNYTAALFRHKVALNHPLPVPSYWVPFSVDRELYDRYALKNLKVKVRKVGFIGTAHNSSKELYAQRVAAIDFLLRKKRLAITQILNHRSFARRMLFGKDYIQFLTKYLFDLTCGGICNFMTAKYFQIPAAFSMLVCTDTCGLELFPKDTYILYQKDNLNQLMWDLNEHEKDMKQTKMKIGKLHNYVMENHNHQQRAYELIRIIKDTR